MKRVLCGILLLLLVQAVPAAESPGGDWSAAWQVTLDRPTPSDTFPVRVELSPAAFDYSTAQPGGEDLRFMDADRMSLPYWIESWDPEYGSVVWVNVPSAGTTSFTMLSGNPAAAPESGGEETFLFFDDFSSMSLDPARWDEVGGGRLAFGNGILISTGKKGLFARTDIPGIYDTVLEVRGKFHGSSDNDVDIGFGRVEGTELYVGGANGTWINAHGWEGSAMTLRNAGGEAYCFEPLDMEAPLWDSSGYHTYSISFAPDSMAVEMDGAPYLSHTTSGCSLAADTLPVALVLDTSAREPDYPQYVDWVRVRPAGDTPAGTVARLVSEPAAAPAAAGTGTGKFPVVTVAIAAAVLLLVFGVVAVISRRGFRLRHGSAPRLPRPSVSVTKELPFEHPHGFEIEISNPGPADMTGIRIEVTPPADISLPHPVHELAALGPAESRVIPVPFTPLARGMYVLQVEVQYDLWGLRHTHVFNERVKVK